MKKILFALFVGLVLLTGSALAQVDCKSGFTACQVADKMFGGARQPAIHFNMLGEADVPLHADVWGGTGCSGVPDTSAEGVLHLMQGPISVFIRFDPPIPEGTVLSIIWTADDCGDTDCIDYTIGSDPGGCEDLSGATAGNNFLVANQ